MLGKMALQFLADVAFFDLRLDDQLVHAFLLLFLLKYGLFSLIITDAA